MGRTPGRDPRIRSSTNTLIWEYACVLTHNSAAGDDLPRRLYGTEGGGVSSAFCCASISHHRLGRGPKPP